MITKQELLTFVNDLSDDYFSPELVEREMYRMAGMLYTRCTESVVLLVLSRKALERLGYDSSGVDDETLEKIASEVFRDLNVDKLVVRKLNKMKIPKKKQEDSI